MQLTLVPSREEQPSLTRGRGRDQPLGLDQPPHLLDRMVLEERLQLGQPELESEPAATSECREIGIKRRAHGRGLADAGLHGLDR